MKPTILENIAQHAGRDPDRLFCRLIYKNKPEERISYGRLVEQAGRYAALLANAGCRSGGVAILVFDHGPELLEAFAGAAMARAIPSVFPFPSSKVPKAYYESTLLQLLGLYKSAVILTDPARAVELRLLLKDGPWTVADTSSLGDAIDSSRALAVDEPDRIVLLQHSSGTTGLKKGVALTNASVIHQLKNYASALSLVPSDRIVSWLPLYHDMGLVACFLLPLVCGVPVTMMSPFEWVADPALLFRAISEDRSTLCWLPNFAYNFLASNVAPERSPDFDLRSIRAFINCSEPIQDRSHQLFLERFRSLGVRETAFASCYAMAENTFAVTQSPVGSGVRTEDVDWARFTDEHRAVPPESGRSVRRLVSSGRVIAGNRARIVGPEGQTLPDRAVGEIAISSDSLMTGYYHRDDLTAAVLKDGWYATGDLGFFAEGELYVTGRKKDMIIVAGKNIYPQDVEEIVGRTEGVYPGRVVCFGVASEEKGTEDVVVLAETTVSDPAKHLQMKLSIARAVRDQMECVVNQVVLLPHMWLIKSTSGKISRSGNRERYINELKGAHVV
ncbi:MAG: AMP-binding protein [Elusimicrobia bacterium]|nr:AMP-binding protein [Elusimicrobiota bacterium]